MNDNNIMVPPAPPVPLVSPRPQVPSPQGSNVLKLVAIVGGAGFAVIVVVLLIANLMKSNPSVVVAAPPLVPSLTPSVEPSPVAPPVVVPTVLPIDEAMADIKSEIFVEKFCNMTDHGGGTDLYTRILNARSWPAGTTGRSWIDASDGYGIPVGQLVTSFYGLHC